MHELGYLKDLVVILSVAIIIVVVFHRLKLPPIAGFILSGVIVGPKGLALIGDVHQVEVLAEIGVALLLFGIGVELSLTKLKRLWRQALIGGMLQVGLTITLTYFIANMVGLSATTAIILSFTLALSSTAIVLRGLQQRGEVDTPHGQLILGILVFQDFSVVPIMLIIPLLIGADLSAGAFAISFAKSIGIILVVLLLAVMIVPRILKLVAKTRQRQLFILAVFVVCLGTAWLVTLSGASLAIGAFLAGLVVAGSEYRHQALADMLAFREIFASLFFVSVGMLLVPSATIDNIVPILIILAGILLGKAVIVFLSALFIKLPLRTSILAGLSLAQVGEFSFVIIYAIQNSGVMDNVLENSLISAAILSMFITPFFMSFGPRIAAGLGRLAKFRNLTEIHTAESAAEELCKLCDHIIIAGYGFAGRELSQALGNCNIPYIIVDLNIENVKLAISENKNVVYGDITSDEVMLQLGLEQARELVILINDPTASEHAIKIARRISPDLFISVRTAYLLDVESMNQAGANEVVPAEREAAVQVTSQVLKRNRIEQPVIFEQIEVIREHLEED